MSWRSFVPLLSVFVLLAFANLGCSPDFPNCDTDDHCQDSDEGQAQDRLYCVNGLCQQCRDDTHCSEGQECVAGACEDIPGWCAGTADCPGNQVCRDNRCGPECLNDGDCDAGYVCEGGSCVEEPECTSDADCPGDQVCQRQTCVDPPEETCHLEPVYFPFDSSQLTSSARSTLQANARCIQDMGYSVQVEGHCDERGTTEYNLGLGQRRANAVRDYLSSLGVSRGNISTTSYGDQRLVQRCGYDGPESCHERNRRAVFNIR